MRKLLVLSPFAVVPPRYGGPLRVYNLCHALSRYCDVRQFAQQVQRRDVALTLAPAVQRITPTYLEYANRDPLSLALYALTSLKWNCPPVWQSAALGLYAPRWLRQQLAWADIIQVETPWQFRWVYNRVGGRKPIILDALDIASQLHPAERIFAPRALASHIAHLIKVQEAFALSRATMVITVSPDDAADLVGRYGLSSEYVTCVSMGADCATFRPVDAVVREQRKALLGLRGQQVVLFAGSMHSPNIEAVNQILAWAADWPNPTTTFLIAGTISRAFPQGGPPNVRFSGPVDDVVPLFQAADVAVNPMLWGSGINQKQLEFMAAGLPTIATTKGVRGIPVKDGVHGFVCSPEAIPECLRWLLDQPLVQASVGARARALVEQTFDWPVLAAQMAAVYERVAALQTS